MARGVEESRRQALEKEPRVGSFSFLEHRPKIVFTTRGRVTGLPREKWWLPFAPDGDVVYLLEEEGDRADWVRNVLADPQVDLDGMAVVARIVDKPEEIARARELCGARCLRLGLMVGDLVERGLVVAFELHAREK